MKQITKETWKPIEGASGYEVSNKGRVRSIRRTKSFFWSNGVECVSTYKGRVLRPIYNQKGYQMVRIYFDDKTFKSISVHRLVAIAFVHNPRPNEYNQVNHINGKKDDNYVENLEWCNNSMNQKHAHKMGLIKSVPSNKKSIVQIDANTGKVIKEWESLSDAYKGTHIIPRTIVKMANNPDYVPNKGNSINYRWEFINKQI